MEIFTICAAKWVGQKASEATGLGMERRYRL